MWLGRQFWRSQVLESEVESKSIWTWTPPWCGRPSSSSLTPWPSPSPCWSSPLFLINKTCMEPNVSSGKQSTRLERTWSSNCRARALVIGPCIVCKGEMSSSMVTWWVQEQPQPGVIPWFVDRYTRGRVTLWVTTWCVFRFPLARLRNLIRIVCFS
jgi:hypothetical protein